VQILTAIVKQDEEDRQSLALVGQREGKKANELSPSPSGRDKPFIKLDPKCLACSGNPNELKQSFKVACLQYHPSDIKYRSKSIFYPIERIIRRGTVLEVLKGVLKESREIDKKMGINLRRKDLFNKTLKKVEISKIANPEATQRALEPLRINNRNRRYSLSKIDSYYIDTSPETSALLSPGAKQLKMVVSKRKYGAEGRGSAVKLSQFNLGNLVS